MKNLCLLLSAIFVILLTGCVQNQVDLNPRVSDPHLIIENPSLNEWLELEKVNYFEREDGLLIVEAKFKNLSSFNKKAAYKIEWMDKNGFTQKSLLSKWSVVEVEQNRSFIIHGISPSIKVKDFEIRLQLPTTDDNKRKDSYHNEYQN